MKKTRNKNIKKNFKVIETFQEAFIIKTTNQEK